MGARTPPSASPGSRGAVHRAGLPAQDTGPGTRGPGGGRGRCDRVRGRGSNELGLGSITISQVVPERELLASLVGSGGRFRWCSVGFGLWGVRPSSQRASSPRVSACSARRTKRNRQYIALRHLAREPAHRHVRSHRGPSRAPQRLTAQPWLTQPSHARSLCAHLPRTLHTPLSALTGGAPPASTRPGCAARLGSSRRRGATRASSSSSSSSSAASSPRRRPSRRTRRR